MHLRFGETVIVTLCEKGKTNLVGYALVLQRYLQSWPRFGSSSAGCHLIGNDLQLVNRFRASVRATDRRFRRNVAALPSLFFLYFPNVAYTEEANLFCLITMFC